jgi:hypothetical protein
MRNLRAISGPCKAISIDFGTFEHPLGHFRPNLGHFY